MPLASCAAVAARLGRCATLALHRAISSSRLFDKKAMHVCSVSGPGPDKVEALGGESRCPLHTHEFLTIFHILRYASVRYPT